MSFVLFGMEDTMSHLKIGHVTGTTDEFNLTTINLKR